MNTLMFKKDLDQYSDSEIKTIAKMYNLNAPVKDLRWLIAIRHSNKKQMVGGNLEKLSKWLDKYGEDITADELDHYDALYLNDHDIDEIPESIGAMTNLKFLELAGNNIVSLPETFGQLSNLKDLDLSDNRISRLPNSFTKLQRLETLYLKNNPIRQDVVNKLQKEMPKVKIFF